MKRLYKKARGWVRVKQGFCPLCKSSPPVKGCLVCWGDYEYGQKASQKKRAQWWSIYSYVLANTTLK